MVRSADTHVGVPVQYVIAEWELVKWEPSWNLPQFPSEKWKLTYLGPGGLASVLCLP